MPLSSAVGSAVVERLFGVDAEVNELVLHLPMPSLTWRRRNLNLDDDGQLEAVYVNHLTFSWGVHEGEGGEEPLGFPGNIESPVKSIPVVGWISLLICTIIGEQFLSLQNILSCRKCTNSLLHHGQSILSHGT